MMHCAHVDLFISLEAMRWQLECRSRRIKRLEELRSRINAYANALIKDEDIVKKIYVDKVLETQDINLELVESFRR